jgi:vitamin B12 transporter
LVSLSMSKLPLRRNALLLASLSLFAPFAMAQSDWVQGKETVVVGQMLREPLADVLPSVSVLTQQDIQRMPVRDLFELINGLPGVEATRVGSPGNPVSVSMRGASSAQTLVLVDGVPFGSQSAIGALSPLEAIPLGLVQRVEVLRGNATAQYGPGAVGGVINITTHADPVWDGATRINGSAGFGKFGEHQLAASLSTQWGNQQLQMSAGKSESRGYTAMNPALYAQGGFGSTANPAPNGFGNEFYSLGWAQRIDRQTEWGLKLNHSRLNTQFDNNYADAVTDTWEGKTQVDFLSLYAKREFTKDWISRLQYSESQNKQSTYTNGSFNPSYGSFDTRFKNWNWDNSYALSALHLISFGLATSQIQLNAHHLGYLQNGDAIPVDLQPKLNTGRAFVGAASLWGDLNTQLTLSRDQLGQGIGSSNFLVGAGYALGQGYKLTATRSSALLAPTVGQRYDPAYGGNPSLLPERSFSNEAGIQYSADQLRWRLVAFQVEYRNMISLGDQLVSDPFWSSQGITQLENLGRSRNTGYELSSNWRQGRWSLGLNLTWQNPQNIDSSIKPINKARRFGSLRAGFDVNPSTRLSWMTYMTADRYTLSPSDFSASSPSRTSGYAVHNLALEHNWSKVWSGKFSLINAFDKQYSPVAGYMPQPRTWLFNLKYQTQ